MSATGQLTPDPPSYREFFSAQEFTSEQGMVNVALK
jgi:hypothetical protein